MLFFKKATVWAPALTLQKVPKPTSCGSPAQAAGLSAVKSTCVALMPRASSVAMRNQVDVHIKKSIIKLPTRGT